VKTVLVESPFRGETNSRPVRLPSKDHQQQALAWHVNVCSQRQSFWHNGCKQLRIHLPHSSHIVTDEKKGVGGLLQQQQLSEEALDIH